MKVRNIFLNFYIVGEICNRCGNINKNINYLNYTSFSSSNLPFVFPFDNNNEIAYVLLTTVPTHFYQLIAEKGKNCFKKGYSFDEV